MSLKLSLRTAALAVAALPLTACEIPPIDVPFEGEFSFEACPIAEGGLNCPELPAPPSIPGVSDFSLTDSPEFKDSGAALDKIDKVELSELTLEITEGAADFDWLNEMTFQAASTDDSLPAVDIAKLTLSADDKGKNKISLTTTGEDISEYIKNGVLVISAKPAGRLPNEASTMKVAGVFAVTFAL